MPRNAHPAAGGDDAAGNVRHHMHALRRRLEPNRAKRAPSEFVVTRGGGYQLDPERVIVDADEFAARAQQGLDELDAGDRARARRRLQEAVRLYEGDFMADEPYAEWALDERDRLRELVACALHALADLDRAEGDSRPPIATCAAWPSSSRWTPTSSASCSRCACAGAGARRPPAASARCACARCASSARAPASSSPTSPTRSAPSPSACGSRADAYFETITEIAKTTPPTKTSPEISATTA